MSNKSHSNEGYNTEDGAREVTNSGHQEGKVEYLAENDAPQKIVRINLSPQAKAPIRRKKCSKIPSLPGIQNVLFSFQMRQETLSSASRRIPVPTHSVKLNAVSGEMSLSPSCQQWDMLWVLATSGGSQS